MLKFETIGIFDNPAAHAQVQGILVGTYKQAMQECGRIIVRHIRELLGTSYIYEIQTKDYQERKIAGTQPGMHRMGGKASDQPLILTGAMYHAISSQANSDGTISIGLLPRESSGRFTSFRPEDYMSGFDEEDSFDTEEGGAGRLPIYAQIWEAATQFIEKGAVHALPECEAHLQMRMEAALQTLVTAIGG